MSQDIIVEIETDNPDWSITITPLEPEALPPNPADAESDEADVRSPKP